MTAVDGIEAMDAETYGHFVRWVTNQRLSEQAVKAMLMEYAADPDHWYRTGWVPLADHVNAWER